MRKIMLMMVVLLAVTAWAVAQQQDPASQSAPAGSSGQASSQAQPSGASSQATTPSAPSAPSAPSSSTDQSASPNSSSSSGSASGAPGSSSGSAQSPTSGASGSGNVIEGCLGGTPPNFTVTDKAGTTYKLDIPAGADSSPLNSHIGESVQVMGPVTNSSQSSSTSSGPTKSTSATTQQSIQVTRIGRGTGTCPGSGTGASSTKPPSK